MELINKKDALHAVLHNQGDAAVAAVQNIKPVDAVPVVHGRFEVTGMFDDFLKCSVCGRSAPWTTEKYNYCPNCGARMRKGERNDKRRTD